MTYRFGVFSFDSESRELRRGAHVVPLEPQPARALARLLVSAGEVVTREQLREAVWDADTHVDYDRGLAYCLSQIRGALGESAGNPRFIETLPKKGYRFIAPVTSPVTAPSADPMPAKRNKTPLLYAAVGLLVCVAAASAYWLREHKTIIAVSIFDNETGIAEHDRLIASMSDVVVMRLAALAPERLAVNGNAAVLRRARNIRDLAAIREAVQADYVVLGQLQREGDADLRFVTHFIRLTDNTHLKANRIRLPGGDVSRLEESVAAEFERAARQYALGY